MGWQGRCFRRGHRIRKREMWLWYQILPEAWSHTKKWNKITNAKQTHTWPRRNIISIPSVSQVAVLRRLISKREREMVIKSTSKTGDQAISNLQLWILRICHYDIIPDLITPERSCFLLLTLLVMFLVGAIYWFSISLATFYQSDNILLKVQLHCQ